MFRTFKDGDRVAIMPTEQSADCDVIEIASVSFAGTMLVELQDGRLFFRDGYGLMSDNLGYLVPATRQHLAALAAKTAAELQSA